MKKVGIINFHYSTHNYGAVLQAAALESYISTLNYDVEHINYIPSEEYDSKLIQLKVNVMKLLNLYKPAEVNGVRNSFVFEQFRNKWITRTKEYRTRKNLIELQNKYNSVVVGSDQVWRSEYTAQDTLTYFFDFIGRSTKKIS